mmetsp:Transcript_13762/g.42639  ORF Transcript_13762/g.42639 Transcript_13762/m.42639 type:complete len:331 (+) Transcript_13762:631-1623(+)
MNTIPDSSTDATASRLMSTPSSNFSSSCSSISGRASRMAMRFRSDRPFPWLASWLNLPRKSLMEMGFDWSSWITPPWGCCGTWCGRSTSIWRSSSTPLRSISRNDDCVACAALRPVSVSRIRVSTRRFASARNSSALRFRVSAIDASTRSRMIWSTSRPWNPTSVNFVASTLMNGALAIFERRRAISVLPQPVGPIIKMFFGTISALSSSPKSWRRQRFRSAIATARFAADCPTMCSSSLATVARGVMAESSVGTSGAATSGATAPVVRVADSDRLLVRPALAAARAVRAAKSMLLLRWSLVVFSAGGGAVAVRVLPGACAELRELVAGS